MKDSLKILNTEDSGLVLPGNITTLDKTDEEILAEAKELNDPKKSEEYLRAFFSTERRLQYAKSKHYLAELIKTKDPAYAYHLMTSVYVETLTKPLAYLSLSEIAISNKAWQVAKSSLEVTKWLSTDTDLESYQKAESLLDLVREEINKKSPDNSAINNWERYIVNKSWLIESIYNRLKEEKAAEYFFKLLKAFPKDTYNYYLVCKALAQMKNIKYLSNFINLVRENFTDSTVNAKLYEGIAYYYLFDYYKSIKILQNVLEIEPNNTKALLYLALNSLMINKMDDFLSSSNKISPNIDLTNNAALIIFYGISDKNANEVKKLPPYNNKLAKEISQIFDRLLKSEQASTLSLIEQQFKKLNYSQVLPYWQSYIAETYIKNNFLEKAKSVLEEFNEPDVHRLNSWIYRLEGKNELAESELLKHRQSIKSEKDSGIICQMINLDLPNQAPSDIEETFKCLKNAYNQVKEITKQIDLEYGLNEMTCIETGCQDCCTKTFPQIPYTEYLYMREWLEKQPEDFRTKIKNESIKIVTIYKERYKKDPPFMVGEEVFVKHYPKDFTFNCPYLGDNKCNTYEARPFTCRSYSYSSHDGILLNGCKYFHEQFKSATKLTNIRKVISAPSFFNFTGSADEKLVGKQVTAPIPIWFAQDHEETIKKVKEAISNSQTMALHP